MVGGTTFRESSVSVCIYVVQRVLFVRGIRKMLLHLPETSRRCAVRRSKAMRRYGTKSIFQKLMTVANVTNSRWR